MPAYLDPFGDGSPGPYVTLRVTWNDKPPREVLALIDSGADLTQIPLDVAAALELEQIGEVPVRSAHNDERDKPSFIANLEFDGIAFPAVEVVGDDYPIALIGRDLLNQLNTTLLGPVLTFTLVRP